MESIESPYVSRAYKGFILFAGIYDMVVGLSMVLFYEVLYVFMSALDPDLIMSKAHTPEMAHLKMNGIFMFFVGLGYLFPFTNYEKFKFYIPIFGIGLRFWGGMFLAWTCLLWGLSFVYLIFGAIDIIIAFVFVFFLYNYSKRRLHIKNY